MKVVVYTAIFGQYDGLLPQRTLKNVDFICFTDQNFRSNSWTIYQKNAPIKNDAVRSARFHKINPHLVLPHYDVSIWIDGNIIILKKLDELIERYLSETNFAAFDHNHTSDKRNTVKQELEGLLMLHQQGVYKDDVELMKTQYQQYLAEGFPDDNGLISSGVLLRKHMEVDVIETMNIWWQQVLNYSKRDQLSFNYAAWKTNFKFTYLPGDIRNGNPWFHFIGKHRTDYTGKLFRYRLKKLFGLK